MKRSRTFLSGLAGGALLVWALIVLGPLAPLSAAQLEVSPPGMVDATGTRVPGDDEAARPELDSQALAGVAAVLPTPVPGETLVFFLPTDNDASATVVTLFNTDSVAHIVALRGFSYNGVLVYSLNINVGATSLVRLASDSVASAPPPSWATPAPIITNFTDFTYFASLSLPKGVKADGYILYNPGTGTIDPRTDQGAVPLRFSTDPATLFLPTVNTAP